MRHGSLSTTEQQVCVCVCQVSALYCRAAYIITSTPKKPVPPPAVNLAVSISNASTVKLSQQTAYSSQNKRCHVFPQYGFQEPGQESLVRRTSLIPYFDPLSLTLGDASHHYRMAVKLTCPLNQRPWGINHPFCIAHLSIHQGAARPGR